jgi:ribosomal protein S6E (S10)
MFNKACARIERQIDDDNPWIAQNAARDALNKYSGMVMGEDKQEITVKITGGMPDVGMPERSEDD